MSLHLLKMAVGAHGFEDLTRRQADRLANLRAAGEPAVLRHLTRSTPRRAEEVLDGGSIYWVMAGAIRARQPIMALEPAVGRSGRPRCAIVLDPTLAATEPMPYRAFQGWRYLNDENAPADRASGADGLDDLPVSMRAELRRLGLV